MLPPSPLFREWNWRLWCVCAVRNRAASLWGLPNTGSRRCIRANSPKPQERETLASVCSTVFAPRKISNLITIETRADFGNFELVRLYPALWANKGDSNRRALISLFARPLLWPPLLVYLYVRILARQKAKRLLRNRSFLWERDDTSRAGTGSAPAL